jgi:hypothetical protein
VVREPKPSLCHREQTYLALDLGGFLRESEQVEGVSSKARTHGATPTTASPDKSQRFLKCPEKSDRFRDDTHNGHLFPATSNPCPPICGSLKQLTSGVRMEARSLAVYWLTRFRFVAHHISIGDDAGF